MFPSNMRYLLDRLKFEKKMSVADFAKALNVNRSAPYNWQTGAYESISDGNFHGVIEFFNRTLELELTEEMLLHENLEGRPPEMDIEERYSALTDNERRLLKMYNKLETPEAREQVIELLKVLGKFNKSS